MGSRQGRQTTRSKDRDVGYYASVPKILSLITEAELDQFIGIYRSIVMHDPAFKTTASVHPS